MLYCVECMAELLLQYLLLGQHTVEVHLWLLGCEIRFSYAIRQRGSYPKGMHSGLLVKGISRQVTNATRPDGPVLSNVLSAALIADGGSIYALKQDRVDIRLLVC